jgi:hypothetical protein
VPGYWVDRLNTEAGPCDAARFPVPARSALRPLHQQVLPPDSPRPPHTPDPTLELQRRVIVFTDLHPSPLRISRANPPPHHLTEPVAPLSPRERSRTNPPNTHGQAEAPNPDPRRSARRPEVPLPSLRRRRLHPGLRARSGRLRHRQPGGPARQAERGPDRRRAAEAPRPGLRQGGRLALHGRGDPGAGRGQPEQGRRDRDAEEQDQDQRGEARGPGRGGGNRNFNQHPGPPGTHIATIPGPADTVNALSEPRSSTAFRPVSRLHSRPLPARPTSRSSSTAPAVPLPVELQLSLPRW